MLRTDRLVELRKKRGLIQQNIADILNISRPAYVQYEKGGNQPPNESIVKLANYFDVSTDYLLGNTDDPTPPFKAPETFQTIPMAPPPGKEQKKEAPAMFTAETLMKIAEEEAGRPLTDEERILLKARVRDLKNTYDQITKIDK